MVEVRSFRRAIELKLNKRSQLSLEKVASSAIEVMELTISTMTLIMLI
jgi:hypothetical protein